MIRRRFLSIAGGLFPLLIPIISSTTDEHPDDDLNDDPDSWGPPDRKLYLDRLRPSEVDQAVEIITSEELVERTEVPRSEVNALLEFADTGGCTYVKTRIENPGATGLSPQRAETGE